MLSQPRSFGLSSVFRKQIRKLEMSQLCDTLDSQNLRKCVKTPKTQNSKWCTSADWFRYWWGPERNGTLFYFCNLAQRFSPYPVHLRSRTSDQQSSSIGSQFGWGLYFVLLDVLLVIINVNQPWRAVKIHLQSWILILALYSKPFFNTRYMNPFHFDEHSS